MRSRSAMAVVVLAALLAAAGCGSAGPRKVQPADGLLISTAPSAPSYGGPLDLPAPTTPDDGGGGGSVLAVSGAAGAALQCDGPSYNGGNDLDEIGSVQSGAPAALQYALDSGLRSLVPSKGYRVAKQTSNRALFTYDVDGRTKAAVLAASGVRDHQGDSGWGVVAWATCDPAELPEEVSKGYGLDVWNDESGNRVPVAKVLSYRGPEHCDWQDITFVIVGAGDARGLQGGTMYVSGDSNGEFDHRLLSTVDLHAALPQGATDTGFRRDGRELWIGPGNTAAYLVSIADPSEVERWPAAKHLIGCA